MKHARSYDSTETSLAGHLRRSGQHSVYRPDHEWHQICPSCRPVDYATLSGTGARHVRQHSVDCACCDGTF